MSPDVHHGRIRSRRREIERRLFEGGLVRGPRRLRTAGELPSELASPTGREFIRRLHGTLTSLGPVFASFGTYLSRRPDLLPTKDCLALGELLRAEPVAPMSTDVVHGLLAEALHRPPDEVFPAFDAEPHSIDPLFQAHRASLEDGQAVLVRVRRFEVEAHLAQDLPLLPLLEKIFAHHKTMDFDQASSDFRLWIEHRADLTVEAGQLEMLASHAADSDLLTVPRVHRQLVATDILTVDWIDGVRIESKSLLTDRSPARRRDVARRLHLLWLEQAMVAGVFPVEADVVLTRDGHLGLLGGELVEMPEASRANLWQYLRSTAAHQPDDACEHLARELEPMHPGATESELLLHLRQLVPFRDGAWTERGDSLAEYLILHWQTARANGFAPRRHMVAFYQGLFWTSQISQRLAPHADALREAQEDMRWLAGWIQFRQLTDPRQMGESLEANLASLLELPQKIDQVLNLATSNESRRRVPARESAAAERHKNKSTLMICLSLMLGTLVLISAQLGELGFGEQWFEMAEAALFLLIGGALLWVVKRS